jgi:hypothetical protein
VTLTKYEQSIYHSDCIFKEILNLAIKIWNSHYFYPSATLREMWPLPNMGNLYITPTTFSRRFWIWPSKFEIHSVALATPIFQSEWYIDHPHLV